ncbi:MAG: AAA family ATPase [Deltaproteobacteria bacterium]|jgi:hypothetical protein|nr:AAA family ATPase [Deltaproteobacteria bacterium]
MKTLPTANQNFREIIERGLFYADKTQYIFKMIKEQKFRFLSRPRRFGETSLLDAFEELFSGDRDLFLKSLD